MSLAARCPAASGVFILSRESASADVKLSYSVRRLRSSRRFRQVPCCLFRKALVALRGHLATSCCDSSLAIYSFV
jgi:hypothetical protein